VGGGIAAVATRGGSGDQALAREVESSHVRSLMLAHLLDVPSTDQHTVKPWFAGKVDVSPPVVRLDSTGTILLGGRLDYVRGRTVAVVVYQRRRHVVNLYAWPAAGAPDAGLAESDVDGYHLLRWREGGVELWAVSDLNLSELREFAAAIRSASTPADPAAPPRPR
jgi:anti-sigma factor RsiW